MADSFLQKIELQLDELIGRCAQLERENAELRTIRDNWNQERTRLVEKNEIARTRVEAMIERLKNIDSEV